MEEFMGPSAVGRSFSVRMGPPDPPRRQDPAVRHQQGNTVDNSRSEFTTEVGASQRSAQARTDDNTQGPLDLSAGQGKDEASDRSIQSDKADELSGSDDDVEEDASSERSVNSEKEALLSETESLLSTSSGTRSASPASQDRLCEACEHIVNFTWTPSISESGTDQRLNNWHWTSAPIGWKGRTVESIRRYPSCPLCRLALIVITRSWPNKDFAPDVFIEMKAMNFVFGSAPAVPPHHIRLAAKVPGALGWGAAYNLVPIFKDQRPYSARRVKTEQSNVANAREWLSLCKQRHGDDCNEPTMPQSRRGDSEAPHIRLIDLKESRLVRASTNWTYWALSYVWGGAGTWFFTTTTSNIEQLEQPGGLNAFWHEIPMTIQGAVAVVAKLGYRYLWIDSICIVQDDIEQKGAAIEMMDLV